MGMAGGHLVRWRETIWKKNGNIFLTEGIIWKLVKIAQAVSDKKTFKNYTILHMYIAQGQGQITPTKQNFDYKCKKVLPLETKNKRKHPNRKIIWLSH